MNRPRAAEQPHMTFAIWAAVLSVGVTLLLYYRVLGFTLYSDDVIWLSVTRQLSLYDIYLSRAPVLRYRPNSLLLPVILWRLSGWVGPTVLHLSSVLTHALNGWLVAMLARRLTPSGKIAPAMLAMCVYLAFPFGYEVVPWFSAYGHLLAVSGWLAALLGWEWWWQKPTWLKLAGVTGAIFLANFSYEGAVTGVFLLALWWAVHWLRPSEVGQNARRLVVGLAPTMVVNTAYLVMWNSFSVHERVSVSVGNIGRNLLYVLQGMTYPASQFGHAIAELIGLRETWAAAILSLGGLGVLIGGLALAHRREAWLGLAWVLAAMPVVTVLVEWTYVYTSPRLLMLAAPGIALAWAASVEGWWQQGAWWSRTVTLGASLLLVAGGSYFIRSRLDVQAQLDRLYQDVYAEIEAGGEDRVFFNLPAWAAPRRRVYALGTEGIVYKPGYIFFGDLVWINTGERYSTKPVLWHDNLPIREDAWIEFVNEFQPGLDERLATVRSAERVYRVKALPDAFVLEWAEPIVGADFGLSFSNQVLMNVSAHAVPERRQVWVDLTLQTVNGAVEEKVFVHLLCGEDLITQADGALLGEIYPYDYWAAGEAWRERRVLNWPEGVPATCLRLRLGMFHPVTGLRPLLPDGTEWAILPVDE